METGRESSYHSMAPRSLIGVNDTSIYSVFSMCLCNLNGRFTPIFLKITLIPPFAYVLQN